MGDIEVEYRWAGISNTFRIKLNRVCPECGENHFYMAPGSTCFKCGWKSKEKLMDTITMNEYKLKLLDKSIEEQLNEG